MDPLRLRIIEAMVAGATTSRQIAEAVGGSVPKIHYHLKDLEQHGLIVVAKQAQKGNLLENHYRPLARTFKTTTRLEKDLLESESDTQKDILTRGLLTIASVVEERIIDTVNVIESCDDAQMAEVAKGVMPYGIHGEGKTMHLTQAEFQAFYQEYQALIDKYSNKRKSKNRLTIEVFGLSYPDADAIRKLLSSSTSAKEPS